ncbi:putative sulfate exporter family transporter [Pseudomonas sp. JQ170]|uniref:YeiH family protein n=1 Tax=unclassified Pseudomonas TaxID=196821 RepID=UPI00264F1F0E|nr:MULTISPECIES: putative sulfate exporter family transporter [unclassified Pseudomonas]MDN7139773.1 putative sulfate exporter family transporter [Pseudomonas sp. JQ170]WRO73771.1 putative sulfate exporter family transporter [Pseudomonas sp. 170C]
MLVLSRTQLPFGLLTGITGSLALAALAMWLSVSPVLHGSGIGILTLAMLLGLTVGNLVPGNVHRLAAAGVQLCKQPVLRVGVALYGFRLTVQQVQALGVQAFITDALLILSTISLAIWLGTRVLGMERGTAVLIGAGHAICGAAAILASAGVVKARNDQVAIAIACVVLFGTLGMLLYPWLFSVMPTLFGDSHGFGIFTGATLHEVAQVVAAAQAMDPQAAEAAVVTKLIRVLLLAPFLLGLGLWLSRKAGSGHGAAAVKVPLFVLGFIACMLINSCLELDQRLHQALISFDDLLLATAMAALGFSTRLVDLRKAGLKPLVLAAALTLQLMVVGGVLTVL